MEILDIHSKCLDFLLDYQLKTPNFYFVARKINNKNRLAQGMYFRGNENYMVLSFWDSADTKEFIYNINFAVNNKGNAYIEISCRDDEEKLSGLLGHTDASFTLDTYTHVTSDMQKNASDVVGRMMQNFMRKE